MCLIIFAYVLSCAFTLFFLHSVWVWVVCCCCCCHFCLYLIHWYFMLQKIPVIKIEIQQRQYNCVVLLRRSVSMCDMRVSVNLSKRGIRIRISRRESEESDMFSFNRNEIAIYQSNNKYTAHTHTYPTIKQMKLNASQKPAPTCIWYSC